MLRTIEATIDLDGVVTLHEPVSLKNRSRAIVTILDDSPLDDDSMFCALMSESALSRDWLCSEDETAFEHLADLPAIDNDRETT